MPLNRSGRTAKGSVAALFALSLLAAGCGDSSSETGAVPFPSPEMNPAGESGAATLDDRLETDVAQPSASQGEFELHDPQGDGVVEIEERLADSDDDDEWTGEDDNADGGGEATVGGSGSGASGDTGSGSSPAALAGTWRASELSMSAMFAALLDHDPTEVAVGGVTGDLLMTIETGGAMSIEYQGVTIWFESGPIPSMELNGWMSGSWSRDAAGFGFTGENIDMLVSSPFLGDEPIAMTGDAGDEGAGAIFEIPTGIRTNLGIDLQDNILRVTTAGNTQPVWFPTTWHRV